MSEPNIKYIPTAQGPMLTLTNDAYVGVALAKYGEYGAAEQVFFKFASRGGASIDCGANLGAHSLFMARNFSSVYAFEPQELIFRLLCANLAGYNNAYPIRACVGNTDTVISMPVLDYGALNNFGGFGKYLKDVPESVPRTDVQVRMLDHIAPIMAEQQIDLVKIDVEGMESEVIEGAMALIDKFKPVLYVENDKPERSSELLRLIYNLDYRAWWHVTQLYNEKNFRGSQENLYGNTSSFNLICLHKDSILKVDSSYLPCTPENPYVPEGCTV